MTNTAATQTVKPHIDGGTYTEVAFAETRNGFGISITRWVTYRDAVVFEVNRVSDTNRTLRISSFDTEAKARSFANEMWKRDR
jgi:hypothetical protein